MEKPITLCDRCDNQMRCLLNYDGKSCRKSRTVDPTNADRIRAMRDEELAEFLDFVRGSKNYPIYYTDWLEWLKQEVNE